MKMKLSAITVLCFVTAFSCVAAPTDEAVELAKKLANPVAAMISIPIQANYDRGIGAGGDGNRLSVNFQPVIPFPLNKDWNLISRTILPVISQRKVSAAGSEDFGIGDITQSLFFSPNRITTRGLIWGIGPVFLLPTASESCLGQEKWGAGPTGVVLKQTGPWTCGMLANHIQSFAGASARVDVSATFLEPFVSYITKTRTTISLNTESTYDWNGKERSVPVNFIIGQMIKIGRQHMQVGAGVRYWAETPAGGPQGWGARLVVTFLVPEKK